jgi:hypothetical protein
MASRRFIGNLKRYHAQNLKFTLQDRWLDGNQLHWQEVKNEIFLNKRETRPKIRMFTPIVVVFSLVIILFLYEGLSALSLTSRVLFVLFLPGFSILLAMTSREFDLLEKLILSPIIGVAYTSLTALYLSVLHVPINEYTIILFVLLLSVPLLAYSWKRGRLKTRFKSSSMPFSYFVLILLFVVSIALISLPLPKNGILIPMGDDPATSTLAATMIAQQGKIPKSWAPYFPEQTQFTFPPGYPSVVAFLYLLDPSVSMPMLVSFFSAFFAIIHGEIFVLTRRVLHDIRIALCATAISALLSIGFYQMMIYGRFPALAGVALTLCLMLFSYLYSVNGNRKMLLLAGITLASLFLTYTISFITATLFVILFFCFGLIFFQNRKKSVFGGATVVVIGVGLSLPWVFNILSRLTIKVPLNEYQALLIWFNADSIRSEFGSANLFMYYSYWFVLFGIIGLLAVLVRRRIGSFLLAWFLSLVLLMLNEIFQIHFPGWYYLQSRAFLNPLLSFPLSVLGGIGFVKLYDFLKNRLRHSSRKFMKTYLPLLIVISLLLSTYYFESKPILANAEIQTNRMSTADYNAIIWISNNTPQDAVIFNDHWVGTPSTWIPVIGHRRIVMPLLSVSEVGWTNMMFTRQDESIIVAGSPNSTEALSILKKYNVSYIYLSNNVSSQVQNWRGNYDPHLFLQSPHYEVAFNEDSAWVIRVIY